MKKSTKRTVKVMLLTGVLAFAAVGGVASFLTDREEAENRFVVGKVEIELREPSWKPEEHEKIEPLKVINKDPQIRNTGINDAFVYLEISVPMKKVMAADEEGNRLESKLQELFFFEARENWTELEHKQNEKFMVYVYAYDKILKPEETTNSLFDTVRFLNVIEGQLDTAALDMPVKAYAIQTSYTGGNKNTVPEQAKEAYRRILNQNRISGRILPGGSNISGQASGTKNTDL